MYSLLVINSEGVKINEIYPDVMEEEARDRFKEVIRDEWKLLLSANNCPIVDDQCWKDILDAGQFSIRNSEMYLQKVEVKKKGKT